MAVSVAEKTSVEEKIYTLEEYFELEEKATYKSEFHNGKIIAMAGGTIPHNKISGNLYHYLRIAVKHKDCEVFNSDQKIYIPAHHRGVYSDTCVVKGEIKTFKGGNQAILNPILIAEVSSDSTASYDRRGKFRKYKTLSAFREYLLVEQDTPIVDVLYKRNNGEWVLKTYIGLNEKVHLQSIDCEIKMTDIYENIKDLQDPQIAIAFDPEDSTS